MKKKRYRTISIETGFTLIELMVTIAIIAIASVVTIPNMIGWLPNYRISQASSNVLSTFRASRLRAVKENANVVVQFNTTASTYSAFLDNGALANNGIRESDENVITRPQNMPAGITISNANFGGTPQIIFNSRGLSNVSGTVTFRSTSGLTRQVQVALTGHSWIP